MSEAAKQRRATDETRKAISAGLKGKPYPKNRKSSPLSDATRQKISESLRGHPGALPHDATESRYEFLLLHGYVQSHSVRWGPNRQDVFHLDFAHVEAKVNIEIDGRYHAQKGIIEYDLLRDAFLRAEGWKVIRIKTVQ
jgi:hypothetical protein